MQERLNLIILIFQRRENDTYFSNAKLYLISEKYLYPQQHLWYRNPCCHEQCECSTCHLYDSLIMRERLNHKVSCHQVSICGFLRGICLLWYHFITATNDNISFLVNVSKEMHDSCLCLITIYCKYCALDATFTSIMMVTCSMTYSRPWNNFSFNQESIMCKVN